VGTGTRVPAERAAPVDDEPTDDEPAEP
jgi:hypothetical protein